MSETHPSPLPLADASSPERADAARNRQALVRAATDLIGTCGVGAVTMEAVATRAGVGKGTVFRRFGSREGLMAALVDDSERAWQAAVISGPPPLGPGAEPWDRMAAFSRSRVEQTLRSGELIRAAGRAGTRSYAAAGFAALHLRVLLGQLGTVGDLPMLATALMAPLDIAVLEQQVHVEGVAVERVHAVWMDLARRVVTGGDR